MDVVEHPLLVGVDTEALARLQAATRVADVARGDLLARSGSLRHELLLVLDGFLHSYELTDDGGRVLFEVVGPGGFDGAIGLLGGVAHFTEAATAGRVASVNQRAFEQTMATNSVLAAKLMRALASRISRREHQLAAAALRDPSKRIAKQLLALTESLAEGNPADTAGFRVRTTHQQIADMLGIRRETATIHLHLLARAGAVDIEPGRLRVSRRRLHAVLEGRVPMPPR